jgi:hypothetical protein
MSFKLIDLQFAIQKNSEVGHQQSQMQHKQIHDQAMIADQTEKKAQVNRKKSEKLEQKANGGIGDPSGQGGKKGQFSGTPGKSSGNTDPESAKDASHPYKGHHIDLTL